MIINLDFYADIFSICEILVGYTKVRKKSLNRLPFSLIDLENDGYDLEIVTPYGRVDGILALEGCLEGGSDNRGNDYAIGF